MSTLNQQHPSVRPATLLGSVLTATPLLAGAGAAVLALSGRFGGAENAFTAFWYVAAAAAPAAVLGAITLFVAHWRDEWTRPLALWSGLAVGGWLFGLGSAQVSGLADGSSTGPWQYALLGVGVAVYLLGLVGLTWTGRRAAGPADLS
jgi:hypothetical protein